jgi:hypothetical protein
MKDFILYRYPMTFQQLYARYLYEISCSDEDDDDVEYDDDADEVDKEEEEEDDEILLLRRKGKTIMKCFISNT